MKQYVQPQICVQSIEANTIICVSVTNITGSNNPLNMGGGSPIGAQYAI